MDDLTSHSPTSTKYTVTKITGEQKTQNLSTCQDNVATEAPLLIRYCASDELEKIQNLATLLRTPTNDYHLACGFMFAEGYIHSPQQIDIAHFCQEDDAITIVSNATINIASRPHLTHSGCGICALETIENLYQNLKPVTPYKPPQELILQIINNPAQQPLFQQSGGTHASVIYDQEGKIISKDEDIGRHNALDKAIGKLWLEDNLKQAKIAWVSGRIGFELVQKCINAGIANLISVGAPTSLSIDYAKKYGINLYTFARNNSYNQYSN